MNRSASNTKKRSLLAGVVLATTLGLTGCQVEQNGQVLPSANAMSDSVQYFPTGPKFKLEKEAAAMKAYGEQQAQAGRAYADQQVQAGRAYADQQVQQASGMIPSMSMLPYAQPADNSVTISSD